MKRKSLLFALLLAIGLPWAANAQQSLPYVEGFEDYGSGLPTGWTKVGSGTVAVTSPTAQHVHNGDKSLRFSGATSNVVALPQFTDETNTLQITLYTTPELSSGSPYTSCKDFDIGYITDLTDASTFVALATYNYADFPNGYLQKGPVSMATAPNGAYIALRHRPSSSSYYWFVDDITVKTIPSCTQPTLDEAMYITNEGASFQWTENGSATNWVFQYSTDENFTTFTERSWPMDHYAISGLISGTTYYARVKSVCGSNDESDWSNVISFTTLCDAYTVTSSQNYSYGFEEEDPFICWTVVSGNITRMTSTTNSGSYRLDFRGSSSNMIALPQFTNATNTLRVEFYTRPENTGGNSGKFAVGYMTDISDASTFVAVKTYNSTEMTTNYVKETVDFDNAPAGANIAMRQFDCSYNYYWYVDDVTVKLIPSCLAPSGLSADASADYAQLSWTANSSETAWTLYYKKTTEENYTEVPSTEVTNPYTLDNLYPAANYEYYVVANCSATDASEPSEVFTFATECDVIAALGYSENFDSYTAATGFLPLCWNRINEGTNTTYNQYPYVYGYGANSGSNCLRLYAYGTSGTSDQYAILPEMTGLNGKQISLQAKAYNSGNVLKIGMMTDPADASTFVEIASETLTTSYQPLEYILGQGNYVAFLMEAPTSSTTIGIYIDDIAITEAPTCVRPSGLEATATTSTTATLRWTAGGSETAWQICLNDDETNLIMADSNPFTIDEEGVLAPATTYTAKVRAYCDVDDQSDWSLAEVSFTTACTEITSFPWTEGFESFTAETVPTCWDNSASTSSTLNNYPQRIWGVYSYNNNKMIRMYNYYVQAGTALINSPVIVMPSVGEYELTFDYSHTASCGDFTVKISQDGGTTFTDLQSYSKTSTGTSYTDPGEFTPATISLADYAGKTIILQFYANADYGSGAIFVDNVKIALLPTCIKPTDLEVTATTMTTATLDWTNGGSETAWQICINGDESNPIDVNQKPYTLAYLDPTDLTTALTPATTYTVKVRAYCNADDQSEWSTEVSFTTDCEVVTSFPWSENFNSLTEANSIPNCWNNDDGTTTNAYHKWCYNTSTSGNGATNGTSHDGSKCVRFDSYNNSADNTNFLKTPVFSLPNSPMQLSFWYKNPTGGDFSVYISTDGGETYTTSLFTDLTDQSTWEKKTYDLTDYAGEENMVIVFGGISNWEYGDAYIYLDDVEIAPFFTKTIAAVGEENWAEGKGGYYLIASPLAAAVDPATVGMITDELGAEATTETSTYDLYSFDQEQDLEWRNYRAGTFNLVNGQGYLYASKNGTTLTFTGAPGTNGEITLSKTGGVDWEGWNLVGNPFAQTAYPDRAFYVMNAEGSEIEPAERNSVEAMEGIFVIAENDGETMTFTTESKPGKGQIVLNVTQNRGNVVDRAIVRFGQESMLPKFMLNENHTKMYITKDNEDYAVVRSNKAGELPVNFEPAQNGTFTISVNTENVNVKYLHLIDRATGMDTDLLQTPIYKFDARTNDDPKRFVLVYKTIPGIDIFSALSTKGGNTDDFSFFSNGNWIINNDGDAILQVVDINGQILSSEQINGCVSKSIEAAPGIYMLRLINGENVKVQKIVVQ